MTSEQCGGTLALLGVTLTALIAAPAAGQAPDAQARVRDLQPLVRAVYAAVRGRPPGGEIPLGWSHAFFKGERGYTYVPFTVTVERGKVSASALVMYVFVTPHTDARPRGPSTPTNLETDVLPISSSFETAFEATYFVDLSRDAPPTVRVSRAFSLPAGSYDVYVALGASRASEAGGEERRPPGVDAPHVGLTRQQISIPDLWTPALATSTLVVAERVEPLTAPLTLEQQEANPYALSGWQIVPATSTAFIQANDLSVFFFVYNAGVTSQGKPDLGVEYAFHQRSGGRDTPFTRTAPQQFTAATMPGFSVAAGDQIIAGQAVPLKSFPAGTYRLEVKVVDRTSGSAVIRTVDFVVRGQE